MSDLTVAVASNLVSMVFADVVNTFKADFPGQSGSGAFRFKYDAAFHFRNDLSDKPRIELRDDGTVFIHDLKVLWDKLDVELDIFIPQQCFGGFCIFWVPIKGCVLHAPEICIFGGNPDLALPLKLDGFVNSEASVKARIKTDHAINPARLPGDSDWDAHAHGRANHWQLKLDTPIVDIAPIDIADTVADLFNATIVAAFDALLDKLGLPGWAKDFVNSVLGGVDWIIRTLLGISDKISQWLESEFQVPGGLGSLIETVIAEFFEQKFALPLIEDPVPLLDEDKTTHPTALMPVMLPIATLDARVSAAEIVLEGGLG